MRLCIHGINVRYSIDVLATASHVNEPVGGNLYLSGYPATLPSTLVVGYLG